ncbi:16S rRNA (guanine52-N7)-methyltransferase GidB [Rubidibacter lacunae KORDI 51-2]|uniref:Ribosomal RNA small subunit methyltransferase G n=1 Tax=Rubidibacter lacunae KORDI 51-2 TaxID=582515 RepID=U5DHG9_9CHRO|nr:16S rRNA (guanine(527)-N(7))-methyltransferase RsmG [Rubidibacter lacunae]ERN41066.1 16S rRNA (guanine52-N7)-methyltransferase GidB [Rubidibacter lacunae KORDI 51-2]
MSRVGTVSIAAPDAPDPLLPEPNELWQETCDWQPDAAQAQLLQALYARTIAVNRQLNLTRIISPEDFWEKHLWDSLRAIAPLGWLNAGATAPAIVDIGTGGGFPGLPIAIAVPQATVALNDATRKKLAFLDGLVAQLGLENVRTLAGRAEAIGHHPGHRARYDAAMVRAVGPPSVCAEYGLPLLKIGGTAVLYRGRWSNADTEALRPALAQLGGELVEIAAYKTPLSRSNRHCLYVRKRAKTPSAFPRAIGIPTKTPL